jgi:lactate dehydrogenase-like 2-hydroxyacid dehydrogenase
VPSAGEAWVKSGDWVRKGLYLLTGRVRGKRAGILGLGRISYEMAERLAGFDMDIVYNDTGPKGFASDRAGQQCSTDAGKPRVAAAGDACRFRALYGRADLQRASFGDAGQRQTV